MREGRFITLNNILCLTATNDGTFCPQHVFGKEHGWSRAVQQRDVKKENESRSCASQGTSLPSSDVNECPTAVETQVDGNCHVLHIFGVASGGVLLDTFGRSATDFTDDAVLYPQLLSVPFNDADEDIAECFDLLNEEDRLDFGRSSVLKRNIKAYTEGEYYDEINAEAHYCLLSSVEPLNFKGSVDTPMQYPVDSRRVSSRRQHLYLLLGSPENDVWSRLCVLKDKPLHVVDTKQIQSWGYWIKSLEYIRLFYKRNQHFSLPFNSSYSNYYPQIYGRRAAIRPTALFAHDAYGVYQPFPVVRAPPSNAFRISMLKNFRRCHELFRVSSSFHLSRKELRKPFVKAKAKTGLYIHRSGFHAAADPKHRIREYWKLFVQYYICFDLVRESVNGTVKYGFASTHFSCSEQFKKYCGHEDVCSATLKAGGNEKWSMDAINDAWHSLVMHQSEELFRRIQAFSIYLFKVRRRANTIR